MSKARKLQIEVDSTLKKAHEGVEVWEHELEKHLSDANSKEKARQFDALKRDLKKLQKLRELIRNWLNTGEVKGQDEALQEARKRIEACMERFKRCEREHKVTRFSKAGLQRDDTDPAVIAKIQCADWLNEVVTQLETQIEQQEAELEALGPAATGKGKSKSSSAGAEKAKELSFQINRHQEYVSKVERVLRLLENDQVKPEEVEHALKDSLDYFVEAAYEEGAAFIEDEEIWSLLPLDSIEENVGKIAVHKTTSENLSASREGSNGLKTGPVVGSIADNNGGPTKNKEKVKSIKEEEKAPGTTTTTSSVGKVIAGLATSGASATTTTTTTTIKNENASLGGGIETLSTDGAAATAVTTPRNIAEGGGGGAAGGEFSAATTISSDTGTGTNTNTGTGTGTPSSFTSGPTPSPMQQEQQQCTPPPGFATPVSVVPPQQPQQAQQDYLHVSGPPSESAPGSPFAASNTYLNQPSAQQQQHQQQQQQQLDSSEDGSVKSSDLTGGSGFRSPFAAKAATAFTPQHSLEEQSSSSSSYLATAATVLAVQQQQQPQQAPPPSSARSSLPTSPLGADWFSFSASWIGEADSQLGAATTAGSGTGTTHAPGWLPSRQDIGLLEAGAVQHRPTIGDADWRRTDGVFSTPAEEFYFSNHSGGDGGGGGGGGGGGDGGEVDNGSHHHHPISAIGTRPEWRPRYPTFTPLSYPTGVHPSLKNENMFSKLQLETLFFSFFFHQGSRQQLFAANRLKLQGWRYHKKLSTWFARTMQPEVVTENFEEGVMAFWDPGLRAVQISSSGGGETPVMAVNGWNQGTTAPNFRFEYNLLENEDTACPSG